MDAAISTAANVLNIVFFLFEALRPDAGFALMTRIMPISNEPGLRRADSRRSSR
jgi:hypothetical protein